MNAVDTEVANRLVARLLELDQCCLFKYFVCGSLNVSLSAILQRDREHLDTLVYFLTL